MTWAILVINIKGGTGKSTVAEKLTKRLNEEGYSVGAFDADIDSANLSTRMGVDERVSFKGDHTVEPVEKDGMMLYSMENAFSDSSFSQSGQFMRDVVNNMINHSDWGDIDYMVVDCPPGSSDIFDELVRALRPSVLGAVSVGIPDAVSDTARLVKVCNHEWVPIIGFIENMSGIHCHGKPVKCTNKGIGESHDVEPFGSGNIKEFVEGVGGNYMGSIPLCVDDTEITDAAPETFDNLVSTIEREANDGGPIMPEDNLGEKGFIRNLWGAIRGGIKQANQELDIEELQDKFGVEGRDPLTIKLELTDASGLTSVLSEVIFTIDDGSLKPIRPRKAKGMKVEGGIKITSQDLHDAMRNEKQMMNAVTGNVITEEYSIIDAVRMGDAEIWGDKTINRLSVLDTLLSEAVSMDQVTNMIEQ